MDIRSEPSWEFYKTKETLARHYEGCIEYRQVDVQDASDLDAVVAAIASKHSRMDGLIAAAGIQNVTPALDYPPHKITEVRWWRRC